MSLGSLRSTIFMFEFSVSGFMDDTDSLAVGVDCRDDESNDSEWFAGGGGVGWSLGWGFGPGCRGCFYGEAADDVCRSAADEAGERSSDLVVGQMGDVFGDGGGAREELEGEPSLGGAAWGWGERGPKCERAAGDVLEGGGVGGKVLAGWAACVVYGDR